MTSSLHIIKPIIKQLFGLLLAITFIHGCNDPSIGTKKYDLDCPKLLPQVEFTDQQGSYSVKVPLSWSKQILEPIDSAEISSVFFSDSLSALDENNRFIRFQAFGITRYIGSHASFEEEHQNATKEFLDSNPNARLIGQGFTDLLSHDAYFIETEENTDMGRANSMMFLIKADNSDFEYFILNSSVYGEYDADFELCQMINVLKSFKIIDQDDKC